MRDTRRTLIDYYQEHAKGALFTKTFFKSNILHHELPPVFRTLTYATICNLLIFDEKETGTLSAIDPRTMAEWRQTSASTH